MGDCSSRRERGLISNQEVNSQHSARVQTQAEDSAMGDRSDFNSFKLAHDHCLQFAKEKNDYCDKLTRSYHELTRSYHELEKKNESLRQRINNDSEMDHRSHQSSSEDATSRNKRSDVLNGHKKMDGATRRQAMEAFGRQPQRAELWHRKDLTCRIFLAAYDIAERTKVTFTQQALPKFFQCAPSVDEYFEESSSLAAQVSKQRISEEVQNLLSTKSFKVACFSVLKEMAVSCDLTDLEEKLMRDLKNLRDDWKQPYPWLPYLDDSTMENEKMKAYIKECLRLAWRMVNLLPPLKIVSMDHVQGKPLDDFFEKEVEENKEKAKTMQVCVWPPVTDCDNDEVLVKGSMAIIPVPKNLQFQV